MIFGLSEAPEAPYEAFTATNTAGPDLGPVWTCEAGWLLLCPPLLASGSFGSLWLPISVELCSAGVTCGRGGIGRRAALRSLWGNPWKFESSRPHQNRLHGLCVSLCQLERKRDLWGLGPCFQLCSMWSAKANSSTMRHRATCPACRIFQGFAREARAGSSSCLNFPLARGRKPACQGGFVSRNTTCLLA